VAYSTEMPHHHLPSLRALLYNEGKSGGVFHQDIPRHLTCWDTWNRGGGAGLLCPDGGVVPTSKQGDWPSRWCSWRAGIITCGGEMTPGSCSCDRAVSNPPFASQASETPPGSHTAPGGFPLLLSEGGQANYPGTQTGCRACARNAGRWRYVWIPSWRDTPGSNRTTSAPACSLPAGWQNVPDCSQDMVYCLVSEASKSPIRLPGSVDGGSSTYVQPTCLLYVL
jgi:hypothetical protein